MTLLQRNARRYKPALFLLHCNIQGIPMSHSIAAIAGDPAVSAGNGDAPAKPRFWSLTIGSIGVVYGDIGTSTLYAFREAISAATGSGNTASEPVVLGILSLIIWALLLVVSLKYVALVLRADNQGEGGILALLALISPRRAKQSRRRAIMVVIGLVGAALLYGDGRHFLGSDRRRSALCGYGPFRAVSNPHRLVWRGVARANAQLFRTRRAAAHNSGCH